MAERLVSVGCPPLRVEKRYGATLALHLLQTKDTFTSWAESRGLSGAPLREVLTIARALDLATHSFGAKYLMSEPAEVQLRRLYSVCPSVVDCCIFASFFGETSYENALLRHHVEHLC